MVRAQPDNYGRSRAPLQVGAEIFGVSAPSADAEVIGLMAATLSEVGVHHPTLDLGPVGLFRALVKDLRLDGDRAADLLEVLDKAPVCAVNPEAEAALTELRELVDHLRQRELADLLSLDLGELRGYDYHTGPVFAA